MPRRKLREYQNEIGVPYCKRVVHPALFWDMRIGKNLVCCRACKFWDCKVNLIVAPFETFNSWIDELTKENELNYQILEGTRKQRLNLLDNLTKWNILNSEGWKAIPEIKDIHWDALIFDESYKIHNPKNKITKFFLKNFRNVNHRFALSGLPDPEDRLNYVTQLLFVNENIFADKNIKSYWDFRVKMCRPGYYKWVLTKKGKKYLQEKIAEYCCTLQKPDVGLHGEIAYSKVMVKQTPIFYNIQKTIIKELIVEIQGKEIKSGILAPNAFIWLHQLCGGFVDDKFIYRNKLRVIKNYIRENLQGKQFVICAWYTRELDMLFSELIKVNLKVDIIYGDKKPKQRRLTERKFINGEIDAMLLNPACYQYGANISHIDTMLIYSSPVSLEKRRQVEQRIIDVMQKDSGLIVEFNVQNGIDEVISISIEHKENEKQMFNRVIKFIARENYERIDN